MHETSFQLMGQLIDGLVTKGHLDGAHVLDCGSAIANTGMQRSYRELMPPSVKEYVGFDAEPGKNVDQVGDIYTAPLPVSDLVISGQMLEHLTFPLLAAQKMKSAVADDGWMILIAPWQYGIHRYPIDCWRVLPDGMKFLFEGFLDFESGVQANDCWGIGRRPKGYRTPWNISRS